MIGRRKGVRVRYVSEPCDWAVDIRAVLVVAIPFFCMLGFSTSQAHDEREARLEIERTVVEDVRELNAGLEALKFRYNLKEIELMRERAMFNGRGISGFSDRETIVASGK